MERQQQQQQQQKPPPPASESETVLIVGATGNIGVSAAIAALRTGRRVLAVVRNAAAAARLRAHVAAYDGHDDDGPRVVTAEADVTAEDGVQGVVDGVRAGQLPAFQHVYSCVGGRFAATPLTELSTEELREHMRTSFESNFFAYRATMPYLRAQAGGDRTWTLCTGAQGDLGERPGPGMSQGALFALAAAACRETTTTTDAGVRFNEVYLAYRVQAVVPPGDDADAGGRVLSSARFARVYEQLLARPAVRAARVVVCGPADVDTLRWEPKLRPIA